MVVQDESFIGANLVKAMGWMKFNGVDISTAKLVFRIDDGSVYEVSLKTMVF
jgi:hypothetical protein